MSGVPSGMEPCLLSVLSLLSQCAFKPCPSFLLPRGSCLDPELVNCLPSHSSAPSTFHCMETRSRAPRRQMCPPGIPWLALAYLLSCLLASSKAKVFSRCELAKELHSFGLDGYRGYNLADCENPSPSAHSLVCLSSYSFKGLGGGVLSLILLGKTRSQ